MAVPVVAIVGRPNVGKSSLFNWLAGKRIAIVDPTAGVTRDRVSSLIKVGERFVELTDTGGMGIQDVDNLTAEVERQIDLALQSAQLILFVVDARTGLMPLDVTVAERLRHVQKPILCVANKCDTLELEPQTAEFYKLGYGKPICVSSQQNRGQRELFARITAQLPPSDSPDPKLEVSMKLAIVGRRNTGKSTFINCLAQSERVIVSEVAGTTRDSVDVRFERDGKAFIAIDTAGVRNKGRIKNDVEFYSLARAERSIRRADVVLLFLDAQKKISKVDKQLAAYILEQHKPAIFVANKWDLLQPHLPTGKFGDYIRAVFPMLDYVPMAFITAKDGKNVQAVLNLAQTLHKQSSARINTGDLNRVLRQALTQQEPPRRQNRRPKIFYATQVATNPPTIVLFTNGPDLFDPPYRRYLEKVFRDHLPFNDIPIKLYLRAKNREDQIPVEDEDATSTTRAKARHLEDQKPTQRPVRGKRVGNQSNRKGKPVESELWQDL